MLREKKPVNANQPCRRIKRNTSKGRVGALPTTPEKTNHNQTIPQPFNGVRL
jgi:hypothetical protein